MRLASCCQNNIHRPPTGYLLAYEANKTSNQTCLSIHISPPSPIASNVLVCILTSSSQSSSSYFKSPQSYACTFHLLLSCSQCTHYTQKQRRQSLCTSIHCRKQACMYTYLFLSTTLHRVFLSCRHVNVQTIFHLTVYNASTLNETKRVSFFAHLDFFVTYGTFQNIRLL